MIQFLSGMAKKTLKMVRDYEKDLARFNKASLDIGFLAKVQVVPHFPKVPQFQAQ